MRFAPALLHLPLQACGTGHFCSAGTKVVSITGLFWLLVTPLLPDQQGQEVATAFIAHLLAFCMHGYLAVHSLIHSFMHRYVGNM